jgi:plasmid stabilization system protein ParE
VSCRLIVGPEAEEDIREAFNWYSDRSPELGMDFILRVETELKQIAETPQMFRKRFGAYRLAATERFPYGIYFIWDEANAVVAVRRVLHFKQDNTRKL